MARPLPMQDTFAPASFSARPPSLARSPSVPGIPLVLSLTPSPPVPAVFTQADLLAQGFKHRLLPRGADSAVSPAISSLWGPRGHTLCASRFNHGTYAKLRLGLRNQREVAVREVAIAYDAFTGSTSLSSESERLDYFLLPETEKFATRNMAALGVESSCDRESRTIAKVEIDQFLKELNAQCLIEPTMTIHDVFYTRGRIMTITELFAGSVDDLAQFAGERMVGKFPLVSVLGRLMARDISHALLRGLSYNLGHHDVSSRNVLWKQDASFYLADYGLVEHLAPRKPMQWNSSSLAAPEHFYPFERSDDHVHYDERLDIWALGVTWLQMIHQSAACPFYEFRTLGEAVRRAKRRVVEAHGTWRDPRTAYHPFEKSELPLWLSGQVREEIKASRKVLKEAIVNLKVLHREYLRFIGDVSADGRIVPALIGAFPPRPGERFNFHASLAPAAVRDPQSITFVLGDMLSLAPDKRASTFKVASFFSECAPPPNSRLFHDVRRAVNALYCQRVLPMRQPSLDLLRQAESMMPACYDKPE